MAVTGKKTIRVVMKVAKNQLHLYMENPYVGNLQWENGLPLSKKENRELHGIGTQNVKRIVEKYKGAYDCIIAIMILIAVFIVIHFLFCYIRKKLFCNFF